MTEAELLAICKAPRVSNPEFSDYYGLGHLIKQHAGFPDFLPVYFHCDHGPAIEENILEYELRSKFKKALFHNRLKVDDARRKFKEVYVSGAPFVYYRRKNQITLSDTREGTVCFPIHSTKTIIPLVDWDLYIRSLKELPDMFHPVTICLHHVDVERGLHRQFMDAGFEVVSAGHKFNKDFVKYFYEFLRTKKYATSNSYGSYVPYCIEFGIPFFFHGEQKIMIENRGNESVKQGISDYNEFIRFNRITSRYDLAKILFSEFTGEITDRQREFAEEVLGLRDAISPAKLNRLLWKEVLLNAPDILISKARIIRKKIRSPKAKSKSVQRAR